MVNRTLTRRSAVVLPLVAAGVPAFALEIPRPDVPREEAPKSESNRPVESPRLDGHINGRVRPEDPDARRIAKKQAVLTKPAVRTTQKRAERAMTIFSIDADALFVMARRSASAARAI